MVEGNYKVVVKIIEVQDIIPQYLFKFNIILIRGGGFLGFGESDTANPYVMIEIGKYKKFTQKKERTLSCMFNQVI